MVLVDALPCRQEVRPWSRGGDEVQAELNDRPWRSSGKCPPNTGDALPPARRRQYLETTSPAPLPASTPSAASRVRPTTQDRVYPKPWLQYGKMQPSELPVLKSSYRAFTPPGCTNPSLRQRPQSVSLRPQNAASLVAEGASDKDALDNRCFSRASAGTPATPIWELLRSDANEDRATPALRGDRAAARTPIDRGKWFDRPSTTDTCISTAAPESVGFLRGESATPGTPMLDLLPQVGCFSPQEPVSPPLQRDAVWRQTRGRDILDKGLAVVASETDENCGASDLAGDSIMRSDLAGDSVVRSAGWSELAGDSCFRSDMVGDSLMRSDWHGDPLSAGHSLISTWSEVAYSRAEWDPRLWCGAREEWSKMGDWQLIHHLWHLARHTTEQALKSEQYKVNGCTYPLSSTVSSPLWFGETNVKTSPELMDADDSVVPPLLVCDADPLQTALELRRIHGERQQIIIVAELNEFDAAGDIDFKNPACVSPPSLPVQTNFQTFVREAQSNLRDGVGNMRAHLSATRDPYVFYCPDVSIFRGSREDGYPFLPEATKVDVIATAASSMRPELNIRRSLANNRQMEWYAHEEDHYALLDRLHLLGLVGLGQGHGKFSEDGGEDEGPILILGTLWCGGGRAGGLPRHAYAHALKGWSEVFCRFFRSVFVCCGGEESRSHPKIAQLVDRIANMSTYAVANEWQWHMIPPVIKWHWNAKEMKLAIRPEKLEEVFMVCEGHQAKEADLSDRAAILGIDVPNNHATLVEEPFQEEEEDKTSIVPSVGRCSTTTLGEKQPLLSPTRFSTAPLAQEQPKLSTMQRNKTVHLAETQQSVWVEVEKFNHYEESRVVAPSASGIPHTSKPVSTWRHSMVLGDVSEEMHHPGETMLSPRESGCVAGVSLVAVGTPTVAVRPASTPSPQKRRASYISKAAGSKSFQVRKPKPRKPEKGSLNAEEINDLIASANKEFDLIARPAANMNDHEEPSGSEGVASYTDARKGSKKAASQPKKQKKLKNHAYQHPKLHFVKPHFYRNNPNESLDAIRRKVCEKVIQAMEPTKFGGHVSTAFEKYSRADDSEEEMETPAEDQSRLLASPEEQVKSGRRLSELGCLGGRNFNFPDAD